MSDRIEKTIDIDAPVVRVWRALTDHREFGAWRGCRCWQGSAMARADP